MIYAYAALMESVPFANGAPNLTVDLPVYARSFARTSAPSAARTLDWADVDENHPGARIQSRLLGLNAGFPPTSGQSDAKC